MSNRRKVYLTYCPDCKLRYYWIVCADGMKSEEFVTAHKGAKIINALMRDGKISRNEAFELLRMLGRETIVPRDEELDEVFAVMAQERDRRDDPSAPVQDGSQDAVSQLIDRLENEPEKRTYH